MSGVYTFALFYMRTELKILTRWYGIIAFQRLANNIHTLGMAAVQRNMIASDKVMSYHS